MKRPIRQYIFIMLLTVLAAVVAVPKDFSWTIPFLQPTRTINLSPPQINFKWHDEPVTIDFDFKRGLDIQGGMQIVLEADMTGIAEEDRLTALDSAKEVILRRVDLYGINEPVVQTAIAGDSHRVVVELPGLDDPTEALSLVGQTAQLEFHLVKTIESDEGPMTELIPTGLSGKQLKKASVQFDPQTNEPIVGIEFDAEGSELFGEITTNNAGQLLAIFLDDNMLMAPQINEPIYGGQAVITGGFSIDEAKQLSIQLNAGALPVPITVLEQRTIGASLGTESVQKSVQAGLLGLIFVVIFMIAYYQIPGLIAGIALTIYALLTIALYKMLGVVITLPGIAGLLLSIGMAVDANILIFERMKEELRVKKPFESAMKLGFGRAWDSIKDANVVTLATALVLINPLNFSFLNTSGMVRGFGVTLFIGVLLGLFTGVVVTRTLVRLFLSEQAAKKMAGVTHD